MHDAVHDGVGVDSRSEALVPVLLGGATRVGILDERQWGISMSAVNRSGEGRYTV